MADLYLERIGLARPTIVKRDNDGEIERLESVGLDIASLVAFWKRCFDLNGLLFEKITLHCKSKDFNAMGQRTLATCRSVRELLAEQGVECVIDDEWFKDHEVKNAQTAAAEEEKGVVNDKPFIGKFKSVDALYRAYERLEAEFTRRSQRLKALEAGAQRNTDENNLKIKIIIYRQGSIKPKSKNL